MKISIGITAQPINAKKHNIKTVENSSKIPLMLVSNPFEKK